MALSPGDVVSIQQLAGWQDIGSSVTISGEVEHAGSYPIQTGERLSSVLSAGGRLSSGCLSARSRPVASPGSSPGRAGASADDSADRRYAYPGQTGSVGAQTATSIQQSLDAQRQEILASLRSHPASGRLIINISSDVSRWENTADDIEMRAGDTLFIPKRPNFVVVSGQVYNPAAISYVPGKDLNWYLRKAGGATPNGDKKQIYVLHADGSVVPREC